MWKFLQGVNKRLVVAIPLMLMAWVATGDSLIRAVPDN